MLYYCQLRLCPQLCSPFAYRSCALHPWAVRWGTGAAKHVGMRPSLPHPLRATRVEPAKTATVLAVTLSFVWVILAKPLTKGGLLPSEKHVLVNCIAVYCLERHCHRTCAGFLSKMFPAGWLFLLYMSQSVGNKIGSQWCNRNNKGFVFVDRTTVKFSGKGIQCWLKQNTFTLPFQSETILNAALMVFEAMVLGTLFLFLADLNIAFNRAWFLPQLLLTL